MFLYAGHPGNYIMCKGPFFKSHEDPDEMLQIASHLCLHCQCAAHGFLSRKGLTNLGLLATKYSVVPL